MPKPSGRQGIKLPRKVMLAVVGQQMPASGGWRIGEEDRARAWANRSLRDLNYKKVWYEPGVVIHHAHWFVLNIGAEPAKNKWGEIAP